MVVGDHLAGPGPAGAIPGPLGAAYTRYRSLAARLWEAGRSTARARQLQRLQRARAAAAAAAMTPTATPGTRAVGPPPSARSAMHIVVPVSTDRPHRGVSSTQGGADEARVRGVQAAAHLPAVPKAAPSRPLVGWRRGAARPTQISSCRRSHSTGAVGSGCTHAEHTWARGWCGGRKYARRLGRARTFIA